MHHLTVAATLAVSCALVVAAQDNHPASPTPSPGFDTTPTPCYICDKPSPSSLMNLTFSREDVDDCGTTSNEANAFILAIHNIPSSRVCFTFSALFENLNGTYLAPDEPCPEDQPQCGVKYTLHRTIEDMHFPRTTMPYNQIYYQQRTDEGEGGVGQLTLTKYPLFDCTHQDTETPWHVWSCNSEGACDGVGDEALNSFSIEPTPEESRSHGTCLVATEEGTAAKWMGASSLMLLTSIVGVLLPVYA